MGKDITVTAVQDFDHATGHYQTGAAVTVSRLEALKLRRRGLITLDQQRNRETVAAAEAAAATAPDPPRRSRRYRRRDMVAEGLSSDSD